MAENGKAKYYALMEEMKTDILSGKIRPGEKLPSENQLSVRYGLSRHTVRKALGILAGDGYIESFQGKGTFCADVLRQIHGTGNIAVVTTDISDYIFPRLIQGIDEVLLLMDIAPDKAKEQLEGIGDTARRGLQDVRRSVRKLKPDALERMSLNNAIHQMIEDMSKVTNTKIYFVSYMEELEFEADEEEVIYSIIQESTTNAIRHGKATEIWIRISEKDEELMIIISDNGCGCESIKEGFGLKHIRERVELLNGEVNYQGMIGFTIIAKIPIRNKLTGKKDRDELNNLADNNDKAKDSQ